MVDALNAEVSLGTIANVREAISWIGYTYLFGMSLECGQTNASPHAPRTVHLWHAAR